MERTIGKNNKKPKSSLEFGGLSNLVVTMPEPTKYHLIEDGKFQEFMKVKKPKCLVVASCCLTYILGGLDKIDLLNAIIKTHKIDLTLSQGIELFLFIGAAIGVVVFGIAAWIAESDYKKILKDIASRPAIVIDPKIIDKMYASQKTK
jgi:hypothetical protein